MKIHIAVCNYNAGIHLVNCIESIEKTNPSFKDYTLNVIDNASKDGSQEYLISLYRQGKLTELELNPINVGKAFGLNALIKKINPADDDLIFSLDSDISLISEDFLNKASMIWHILGHQLTCMVCLQSGNSLMKRKMEFKRFTYPNPKFEFDAFVDDHWCGAGIAGGAILIPYKYWKEIGGYRENTGPDGKPGLYGGNDGNLMLDLTMKYKKPLIVVKDLLVFHPNEENADYQKWKAEQHQSLLTTKKSIAVKGFYD